MPESPGPVRARLVIDFDSTVFPLLDAIGAHPDGAGVGYETIATWAGLADACGGLEEMRALFEEVMVFEWMERFPPFDGATEAVSSLRSRGIEIIVLSDRSETLTEDVKRYLARWSIATDRVSCLPGVDKVDWCLRHGVEMIVDDHPETLVRAHEAGLLALGLQFPYNLEVFKRHSLPRATSWSELGAHIDAGLAARG